MARKDAGGTGFKGIADHGRIAVSATVLVDQALTGPVASFAVVYDAGQCSRFLINGGDEEFVLQFGTVQDGGLLLERRFNSARSDWRQT